MGEHQMKKDMVYTDLAGNKLSYEEAQLMVIENVRIDNEANTITLEVAPAQDNRQ